MNQHIASTHEDGFITRPALAARWGCHYETIRRHEIAGKLVSIRLPGGLRYRLADIEAIEAAAAGKGKNQ